MRIVTLVVCSWLSGSLMSYLSPYLTKGRKQLKNEKGLCLSVSRLPFSGTSKNGEGKLITAVSSAFVSALSTIK